VLLVALPARDSCCGAARALVRGPGRPRHQRRWRLTACAGREGVRARVSGAGVLLFLFATRARSVAWGAGTATVGRARGVFRLQAAWLFPTVRRGSSRWRTHVQDVRAARRAGPRYS